jgi:hypothetical protein
MSALAAAQHLHREGEADSTTTTTSTELVSAEDGGSASISSVITYVLLMVSYVNLSYNYVMQYSLA